MSEWKYLAQITDPTREEEAIRRIFLTGGSIVAEYLNELGLPSRQLIIGTRIPYYYIDPSLSHNDGDIDVLLIPFGFVDPNQFRLIRPDYRYIVALEIKVPYLSKEHDDQLKGASLGSFHGNQWKPGSGMKGHMRQAQKLVERGFDRSALLYLVPTAPRDDVGDFSSFLTASGVSHKAQEEVATHLERALKRDDIVKEQDRFGIAVQGIGTVAGAIEPYRGSTPLPQILKEADINLNRPQFRIKLEEKLKEILPEQFVPEIWPPMLRACSNSKCQEIVLWHLNDKDICLKCQSALL